MVRGPSTAFSENVSPAPMMKPSSTSAARWMFVTRGSPGLYGVVNEPTRSVTRRRCASAVAKAGLMSAIRTGI